MNDLTHERKTRRWMELLLSQKLQSMASRLSKIPADEMLDDPKFQELEERKPMDALNVMHLANALRTIRESEQEGES